MIKYAGNYETGGEIFSSEKVPGEFLSKLLGKERLSGKVRGYCAHSVAVLPGLYDPYAVKLNRHTDNF
ncbi:hypothetical protein MaudCBS49596_000639 [Microsporum audouinii]